MTIDRDKLTRGLQNRINESRNRGGIAVPVALSTLSEALMAVREQKTEYTPDGPDYFDGRSFIRWKCTSCQYFVCLEKGMPDIKYCPNCGRKVKLNA